MFRRTCGDYSCVLSLFAHKAAGAVKRPAFPAPSLSRERVEQQPGQVARRGNAALCLERPSRHGVHETQPFSPRRSREKVEECWINRRPFRIRGSRDQKNAKPRNYKRANRVRTRLTGISHPGRAGIRDLALMLRLLLAFLLFGAVAAVEAASGSTQPAVMGSVMTGEAANYRAFETALRFDGRGRERKRRGHEKNDE